MALVRVSKSEKVEKILLGTGSSYNIANLYPDKYRQLTADNFMVEVTGISTSATSTDQVKANNYSYSMTQSCSASKTINPTLSYNPSTGALNVTGLSGTGTGSFNMAGPEPLNNPVHHIDVSVNLTASIKVYLFLGNFS